MKATLKPRTEATTISADALDAVQAVALVLVRRYSIPHANALALVVLMAATGLQAHGAVNSLQREVRAFMDEIAAGVSDDPLDPAACERRNARMQPLLLAMLGATLGETVN